MFMQSFKYYKSKVPKPDFKEVIDFDEPKSTAKFIELDLQQNAMDVPSQQIPPGLEPVHNWKVFQLREHPGLILIRCPFTVQAQRYWIARCLRDYPKEPNVKNLSERLFQPKVIADWWQELQECEDPNEQRRMKIGLRWATLGYHHNWDTKIYTEDFKHTFPNDLAEMCNYFAAVLGFDNFRAQAAIVNYYPIGTTLAGHTDHSEVNLEAPLFSFSFGQQAIFLIGGQTKDEKPTPLFLKNGDVLCMSRTARLCYHAVPRVMRTSEDVWNTPLESHHEEGSDEILPKPKRIRPDVEYILKQNGDKLNSCFDPWLYHNVKDEAFWLPFRNYLNDSRININVRQVLHDGETKLPN